MRHRRSQILWPTRSPAASHRRTDRELTWRNSATSSIVSQRLPSKGLCGFIITSGLHFHGGDRLHRPGTPAGRRRARPADQLRGLQGKRLVRWLLPARRDARARALKRRANCYDAQLAETEPDCSWPRTCLGLNNDQMKSTQPPISFLRWLRIIFIGL